MPFEGGNTMKETYIQQVKQELSLPKKKKEAIYQAAMLDPHTAAELSIDDIVKMCDELIEAHGDYMKMYK